MLQGEEILKMGYGAVGASSTTLEECQLFPEAWRGVRADSTWVHHPVEQRYFIAAELEAFQPPKHQWPGAVGWAGAHSGFQGTGPSFLQATASVSGAVLVSKLCHPRGAVVLLQSQKKTDPAQNQPRNHRTRAGTCCVLPLFLPSPCQQWIARGNYLGFELYCVGKEKRIGKGVVKGKKEW